MKALKSNRDLRWSTSFEVGQSFAGGVGVLKLAQVGARFGRVAVKLGPGWAVRAQFGPKLAQGTAGWAQVEPIFGGPLGPSWVKGGLSWAHVEPTEAQVGTKLLELRD